MYIRRIVVVCGYGCNLDSPLRPYLDRVARYCRRTRPEFIILCGGATQQKKFPGKTEADVMYGYLYNQLDSLVDWHPGWFAEDTSYTTYENIRDAAAVIADLKAEPQWLGLGRGCYHCEITIFCEATRALKVAILARYFLGFPPANGEPDIRIETASWERMHPFKELMATAKAWLATKFPVINAWQSRRVRAKSLMR